MKLFRLISIAVLLTTEAYAQGPFLNARSINQMLDLLMTDSVSQVKGEPMDETGGIFKSTLAPMENNMIKIEYRPKQPFQYSFLIEITMEQVAFGKLKAELNSMLKKKSLKYNMKRTEDYESGMDVTGDASLFIMLLYNDSEQVCQILLFRE
jgi:hypothetical protein